MPGILEALVRSGRDYRQHGSDPDEFRICCLFCEDMGTTPDTRYRLGINIVKGSGHCFNCNWSSNHALLKIVQKLGEPTSVAYEEVSVARIAKKPVGKPRLPDGFQKLEFCTENDPLFGSAVRYLKKRGVTKRQIRTHEIGATVQDEMYRYRIIFPVRHGTKLAGFVGRDWTGLSSKKYLNSSGTRVAYNVRPDKYGKEMIVLAEGIVKALAIERALKYKVCCAALLSNGITDVQVSQIKAFDEVVIFPDPDKPGMRGAILIAENLCTQMEKTTVAWPLPTMQADEMTPEEIVEVIENREEFSPILHSRMKSKLLQRE